MRLRSITLEGFQSYRERETVDLTGLNLTAIVGPNHAGKSTLISDAILFALFGKSRGAAVGDVISRGAGRCEVSITFDLGDNTYRVTRIRSGSRRHEAFVQISDATEESGWRALTEKNPLNTDGFITGLLGMGASTAALTWMVRQNDYGAFCTLGPAQRRDVLADAFNLGQYAALTEEAEEQRRKAQRRLDKLTYDLDEINARISRLSAEGPLSHIPDAELEPEATAAEERAERISIDLAQVDDSSLRQAVSQAQENAELYDAAFRQQLAAWEAEERRMQQQLVSATREAKQAQEAVAEAAAAELDIDRLRAEITDAHALIQRAETAIEECEKELDDLRETNATLNAELTSITIKGTDIKDRQAPLLASRERGEGSCFTCGQSLTPEQASQIIADDEAQLGRLHEDYKATQARVATTRSSHGRAIQRKEAAQSAARDAAERSSQAAAQLIVAQKALAHLPQLRAREEQMKAALVEAQEAAIQGAPRPEKDEMRWQALLAARDAARRALEDFAGGPQRAIALRGEQQKHRDRARALWQEISRRAQVAAEIASLAEPKMKAEVDVAEARTEYEGYGILVEAFRPSGIPFMILSGVIDELNEVANDIIADLGEDGLAVSVTTASETAKGGIAEKVMVHAITRDGQVDYMTLSGSEQARVALAIRLGLATCIARRTGTPIESIVMDECWGMFDEAGKRDVMNVLIRLAERFSIFSVSHLPDVTDWFPARIEVDMATGTSRAAVTR